MFTEAFAQTTTSAAHAGSPFSMFVPLILIFVVFYFLLIRPQQKKQKEHQAKLSQIQRGYKIITGGGFIATVHKVIDDNELEVDLADGVRVRVMRSMVVNILDETSGKAAPAPKAQESASKDKKEEDASKKAAPKKATSSASKTKKATTTRKTKTKEKE